MLILLRRYCKNAGSEKEIVMLLGNRLQDCFIKNKDARCFLLETESSRCREPLNIKDCVTNEIWQNVVRPVFLKDCLHLI